MTVPLNLNDSISCAKKVIRIETEAIQTLADRIGPDFERAVDLIANSSGRIIVTGMGKSGIIAEKIAATLRSTGTAAFFLQLGCKQSVPSESLWYCRCLEQDSPPRSTETARTTFLRSYSQHRRIRSTEAIFD